MKTIKLEDCNIKIIPSPEYEAIENCLSFENTGADHSDYIEKVYEDCGFNIWLWCQIDVIVSYKGTLYASNNIGQCAYKNEEDFKQGGYYEDMVSQCLEELNDQYKTLID